MKPRRVAVRRPAAARRLPRSRRIPWARRLEARVLLCVVLVAGLSMAALLLAAERVVTSHSLSRSRQDMEAARDAFYHLAESRAEFASAQSRLIVELPIFRSLITDARIVRERDAATLRELSALRDTEFDTSVIRLGRDPVPQRRDQPLVRIAVGSAAEAEESISMVAAEPDAILVRI